MSDEWPDEDRYNRLADLVDRARGFPQTAQREFIMAECVDDPQLASEANEILSEETGGELGKPLVWLSSDLQPGDILGARYVIAGVLGSGAQGKVYEAEDRRLGKRLAIKQMIGRDSISRKLFEREARILGQLRNTAPAHIAGSLPNVTDFFTDSNNLYMAMEYVSGATLAERLAIIRHPYPIEDVVKWGDRILEILEFLHGQRPDSIIHRDIKPANLKLTPDGQLVLLDFGLTKGTIAKLPQLGRGATSVAAHGTAQYASWEQVKDGRTDERGDLFSTGATLYKLLTAEDFPNAFERKEALADGQPDPLPSADKLNPEVPQALSQVLRKAMCLKPDERYASASDMRRAWLPAAGSYTHPAMSLDEATLDLNRGVGNVGMKSATSSPLNAKQAGVHIQESSDRLRGWMSGIATSVYAVLLSILLPILCLWMVVVPVYALILLPSMALFAAFSITLARKRVRGRYGILLRGFQIFLIILLIIAGYTPLIQGIERHVASLSTALAYGWLDPLNSHGTSLLRRALGPTVLRLLKDRSTVAPILLFGTILFVLVTAYDLLSSGRKDSSRTGVAARLLMEPWQTVRRLTSTIRNRDEAGNDM